MRGRFPSALHFRPAELQPNFADDTFSRSTMESRETTCRKRKLSRSTNLEKPMTDSAVGRILETEHGTNTGGSSEIVKGNQSATHFPTEAQLEWKEEKISHVLQPKKRLACKKMVIHFLKTTDMAHVQVAQCCSLFTFVLGRCGAVFLPKSTNLSHLWLMKVFLRS